MKKPTWHQISEKNNSIAGARTLESINLEHITNLFFVFCYPIVLIYCEKKCSSDWELEQFIQTVKFLKHNDFLNLFLEVYPI